MNVAPKLNEDIFGTKQFEIIFTIKDKDNTTNRSDAGYLEVTNTGGANVIGNQTEQLTIQGTQAQCNTSMSNLNYVPSADFTEDVGIEYAQSDDESGQGSNPFSDFMLMNIRDTHEQTDLVSELSYTYFSNAFWNFGSITDKRGDLFPDLTYTVDFIFDESIGALSSGNKIIGTKEELNNTLKGIVFTPYINTDFTINFVQTQNQDNIIQTNSMINVTAIDFVWEEDIITENQKQVTDIQNNDDQIYYCLVEPENDLLPQRLLKKTAFNGSWSEITADSRGFNTSVLNDSDKILYSSANSIRIYENEQEIYNRELFVDSVTCTNNNERWAYSGTRLDRFYNIEHTSVDNIDWQTLSFASPFSDIDTVYPQKIVSNLTTKRAILIGREVKNIPSTTYSRLYRINNFGSWVYINLDELFTNADERFTDIACDDNNTWVAVTNYKKLFRSIDDGVNWEFTEILSGEATNYIDTDGDGIWCMGSSSSFLYISTDNGLTFTSYNIPASEEARIESINCNRLHKTWHIGTNKGFILRTALYI